MLSVITAINPWTYIYEGLTSHIPVGKFYLAAEETLPRSVRPTEFWIATDRADPIAIWINGEVVGRVRVRSRISKIYLALNEPPHSNYLTFDNGIDEPVQTSIAVTHVAKHMEEAAQEMFEYAGRTNQFYSDLISSPWLSFLADYQLPWRYALPNVRSIRIMSTKMAANTLFNESGLNRGLRNLVSAFTATTPVVKLAKNPAEFQPNIYQPVTSGDDVDGYEFHFWAPNLCLARWAAFGKLVHNVNAYTLVTSSEEAVKLRLGDAGRFEQHLFDTTGPGCSFFDLLELLGCMDNILAVGSLQLTGNISICFYSTPFDQMVEPPGIGGKFLDSGGTFDTASHTFPDETNKVTSPDTTDLVTALILATEVLADFNAHDLDAIPQWHYAVGGTHQITAAVPTDTVTLRTFCIDAQAMYADHLADATMHIPVDTLQGLSYTITVTSPIDVLKNYLNDFKDKFTTHQTLGNFDGIYDIDLLTDFWVLTSLSKKFDSGGCLDSYVSLNILPENVLCCIDSPDVVLLTTLVANAETIALDTPNHPLFGGDDPGLLGNPYFANIL